MPRPIELYGAGTSGREMDNYGNIYLTPPWLINRVREDIFDNHIDLDPATETFNPTQATKFYTIEDNGLDQKWFGNVWVNPPYGKGGALFAFKALLEAQDYSCRIVMLLAARPDTKWQQALYQAATSILFLRGRLKFQNDKGENRGTAPFSSVLVSLNVSLQPLSDLGNIVKVEKLI